MCVWCACVCIFYFLDFYKKKKKKRELCPLYTTKEFKREKSFTLLGKLWEFDVTYRFVAERPNAETNLKIQTHTHTHTPLGFVLYILSTHNMRQKKKRGLQ